MISNFFDDLTIAARVIMQPFTIKVVPSLAIIIGCFSFIIIIDSIIYCTFIAVIIIVIVMITAIVIVAVVVITVIIVIAITSLTIITTLTTVISIM